MVLLLNVTTPSELIAAILVNPVTSSVEVISTPAAPFKVNAPTLVVTLDAAAASNEIPALASTVISAPLMSTAPVVVTSTSAAFPAMLTPAAPSKVNAPAASIFIILPLSDVLVLSAEPKVKLPLPLGSIEIAPSVPVVIVIPPLPELRFTAVTPVTLPKFNVLANAPFEIETVLSPCVPILIA